MKIALDWALPAACIAVVIGLPLLWRPPRCTAEHLGDYAAGVAGGGRDKLDALIEATREWPHESYAWGPPRHERMATAGDEPVPYLPAERADLDAWEAELAEGSDR